MILFGFEFLFTKNKKYVKMKNNEILFYFIFFMLSQFLFVSLLLLGLISLSIWSAELHYTLPERSTGNSNIIKGLGNENHLNNNQIEGNVDHSGFVERIQALEMELQQTKNQLQDVQQKSNSKSTSLSQNSDRKGYPISFSENLSWPRRVGRPNVLLVGFPRSGLDVVRKLFTKLTFTPTFSVYTEEDNAFIEDTNVDLDVMNIWSNCWGIDGCQLTDDYPVIIKTYYPAVIMQSNLPEYDKIITVIRNPIDTIASFYEMCQETSWLASRRRAFEYHVKKEIDEYKTTYDFWRRTQSSSKKPMLTLRYEDICNSMEHSIREIISFLDLTHIIPENVIQDVLKEEKCDSNIHIGMGLSYYTSTQANSVQSSLASILRNHDYGNLMDEFNEHF